MAKDDVALEASLASPGEPTAPPVVFISYSSADHRRAKRVCALLEAQGIGCWFAPRDEEGGVKYAEKIAEAIESARLLLLLLSERANQSTFVANEVALAAGKHRPILTFRLKDVQPSKAIALFVAADQWIDGWKRPTHSRVDVLAGRIRKILQLPQRPPPPPRYWRWAVLGGFAVVVAIGALSFLSGSQTGCASPGDLASAPAVSALTAGESHTCALLASGTVTCWGSDEHGQLGNDLRVTELTPVSFSRLTTVDADAFEPVSVYGLTDAIAISAGAFHTCALLSGGTIQCWGENGHGQLGVGTRSNNGSPELVTGVTHAVGIAAGHSHTCAVTKDGGVECWGLDDNGQLGDGGKTDDLRPVLVSGISNAAAIAAGDSHTCALLRDGRVECWGLNNNGQLGDGTTESSMRPVFVAGLRDAEAIVAGDSRTCALMSRGEVECWGYNGFGQLGNGGIEDSLLPVSVTGIDSAVEISADGWHTCARLANGKAMCWGYNEYGELGDGTNTRRSSPAFVRGLTGATEIAVGGWHTCAVVEGNAVKCWGDNEFGQLGDDTTAQRRTPTPVCGIVSDSEVAGTGWTV